MQKCNFYPVCLDHAEATCCFMNKNLEVKPNFFSGNIRHVVQETHIQLPNCNQAQPVLQICPGFSTVSCPAEDRQTSTQSSGLSKDHQSSESCVALLLIPTLGQVAMPISSSTFVKRQICLFIKNITFFSLLHSGMAVLVNHATMK